jgi:hypothetical protein
LWHDTEILVLSIVLGQVLTPPTPLLEFIMFFSPGQIITFPVQVSDPDPVDVVRLLNEERYVGARNSVVF